MRHLAFMVVRDEADILPQTLDRLLTWVDGLWVFDTGSLDHTPDLLADRARADERLTFLGSEAIAFSHRAKAILFERLRNNFRPGDWICRADADERYLVHPPSFLADRTEPHETVVCAQLFDTVLLRRDLAAWQRGDETLADRTRPIETRRTHHVVNQFPELRFFRYRRGMRWPGHLMSPRFAGVMADARIPVRHDKWRDPVQAQWRTILRSAMVPNMAVGGGHWLTQTWQTEVRRVTHRAVKPWPADGSIPPVPFAHPHQPKALRRLAVRLAHGSGAIRLIEPVLPGARAGDAMEPLADDIRKHLKREWDRLHAEGADQVAMDELAQPAPEDQPQRLPDTGPTPTVPPTT